MVGFGDSTMIQGETPQHQGRVVWLASFPKSGNTWMRAIITALRTHPHLFGVDQLSSGSQPNHVGMSLNAFGLDARWLTPTEIDTLRHALITRTGVIPELTGDDESDDLSEVMERMSAPMFRKTHEVFRPGEPPIEPFPVEATRAAILIVRDPRDVTCSFAPFFGQSLEQAVESLAREGSETHANPALTQTAQPWGTWSTHTQSWLASDVPFPVHLVRYEDLKTDPISTLLPVFNSVGLMCTEDELEAAIARTRFEKLQQAETERGFRETSPKTTQFFRSGKHGGWRDELDERLVQRIEADHGEVMIQLGYPLETPAYQLGPIRSARQSRRRQEQTAWESLPPQLGLTVTVGSTPEELEGASHPRPWIQVTPDQALLTFNSGSRLLVSEGRKVQIDWEPDDSPSEDGDDPSWMLQGWAVTLSVLQRGMLSLHAATVRIGDSTVAIAGLRGAGKSTTAMGLRARGHSILCDDVTVIQFKNNSAWTTPYDRNVHLLEDAATALGVDFDSLPRLSGGRPKVAFRPEDTEPDETKIDRIIVLAWAPPTTSIRVNQPAGVQRMNRLLAHTERDGIAPLVLGEDTYFTQVAKLADTVPITQITRPRGTWTLDDVLDLIENEATK